MRKGPRCCRGPFSFSLLVRLRGIALKTPLVAVRRTLRQTRHSDDGARPARLVPPPCVPPKHAPQTFHFLFECRCAGAMTFPAVRAATKEGAILPARKH